MKSVLCSLRYQFSTKKKYPFYSRRFIFFLKKVKRSIHPPPHADRHALSSLRPTHPPFHRHTCHTAKGPLRTLHTRRARRGRGASSVRSQPCTNVKLQTLPKTLDAEPPLLPLRSSRNQSLSIYNPSHAPAAPASRLEAFPAAVKFVFWGCRVRGDARVYRGVVCKDRGSIPCGAVHMHQAMQLMSILRVL